MATAKAIVWHKGQSANKSRALNAPRGPPKTLQRKPAHDQVASAAEAVPCVLLLGGHAVAVLPLAIAAGSFSLKTYLHHCQKGEHGSRPVCPLPTPALCQNGNRSKLVFCFSDQPLRYRKIEKSPFNGRGGEEEREWKDVTKRYGR